MSGEVGTVGWESKRANRAERECDKLQAQLMELERIARDWQQGVTDAETAIRLIVTKFENR